MDTLLPNEKKTFFFYGKNAIDNLENDFENEIDMRFLIDNQLYEKSILKGFHRHRFLNDTMKIIFYDRDSVRINF